MSDIAEFERRLAAALDRIGQGVEALSRPRPQGGGAAEAEVLREELEAERTANLQLEERVKAIKEKQEKVVARLEAEVAALRDSLDERDEAFEKLRRANDQLRTNNAALRAAIENALPDAHLVNKAMMAELDGLRAARAADRAEVEMILAELRPMFGEAGHA